MREIILDLETTGLDTEQGHRIIEVGAIEIINKIKTGKFFHRFINPEREISPGTIKVHGISNDFLKDKPKFGDIVEEFLFFIGHEDKLVIHNAPFDMGFINNELSMLGLKRIAHERAVDTLIIARRKFPGSPANLNALCKRFNISTQIRQEKGHGALLDSELLYQVYICLTEGIQSELILKKAETLTSEGVFMSNAKFIEARKFLYIEDTKEHQEFLKSIPNNLWEKAQ